jgi:hypothetical protein
MSYIITGTDSAGALSLKRNSAAAAVKKALELMGDGCRDVSITAPDGCTYGHPEFDQLHARRSPTGVPGPVGRGGGRAGIGAGQGRCCDEPARSSVSPK